MGFGRVFGLSFVIFGFGSGFGFGFSLRTIMTGIDTSFFLEINISLFVKIILFLSKQLNVYMNDKTNL